MITKFTAAVLSRMKELGVKQKDLADLLGLKRQVVKYKITHDSFSRKELIELQEILKLNSEEILGETYENK
jgi:predicted transcriptional regulator